MRMAELSGPPVGMPGIIIWRLVPWLGTLFLVKQKSEGRNHWPMLSYQRLGHLLLATCCHVPVDRRRMADIINKRIGLRRHG